MNNISTNGHRMDVKRSTLGYMDFVYKRES